MRARHLKVKVVNYMIGIFLVLSILASTAGGQIGLGSGASSAAILNAEIGSRATSLGGAFTAFSDDATAPFWNPSGLSNLSSIELKFGHSTWYQDISINYLGAAIPLSNRFTSGIGVAYVDYGDFQAYSADDQPMGEFSGHNIVLSFSLAYKLADKISLGVTAKGISEKLEEASATGYAFDFGTRYDNGLVSIGLVAKNIGSGLKYEHEKEALPSKISAGIGLRTFDGRLRLAGDVDVPHDGFVSMHQGVEYLYMNTIFLRSGYTHHFSEIDDVGRDGLVYGFGLKVLLGTIDYSFMPNGDYGSIHKLDFSFSFGK